MDTPDVPEPVAAQLQQVARYLLEQTTSFPTLLKTAKKDRDRHQVQQEFDEVIEMYAQVLPEALESANLLGPLLASASKQVLQQDAQDRAQEHAAAREAEGRGREHQLAAERDEARQLCRDLWTALPSDMKVAIFDSSGGWLPGWVRSTTA